MILKTLLTAAGLSLALGASPAIARWVVSPMPHTDVSLRSVQAVSAREFHISGSGGYYAVSRDSGRTWRASPVPGAKNLDFRGLAVVGRRSVVLMSAGPGAEGKARLFHTDDGGVTWSIAHQEQAPAAFFDSIAFWNARDGLVMGDPVDGAYMILRTTDGGRTWARQKVDMPELLPGEAAFAASNSALALAAGGRAWMVSGGAKQARVFRSKDHGATWQVVDAPIEGGETGGVYGARFLSASRGVIVGGDYKSEARPSGNIAVSTDGGASWLLANQTGAPTLKEGVGELNRRTLLAVGPRGTSMSTDRGASWRAVDQEAFHAISCAKGSCMAVGGQGRVAVWRPD